MYLALPGDVCFRNLICGDLSTNPGKQLSYQFVLDPNGFFIPGGLADNIGGTYTTDVDSNRLKHILLIALFCYGQIIASVHIVGHLDATDCHGDLSAVSAECHLAMHELSGSFPGTHSHDSSSHTQDNDHSDFDCLIYHVLLSLNGLESAGEGVVVLTSALIADELYTDKFIAGTTREHLRIRAPPVIS